MFLKAKLPINWKELRFTLKFLGFNEETSTCIINILKIKGVAAIPLDYYISIYDNLDLLEKYELEVLWDLKDD